MANKKAIMTSKMGALWLQRDGPNTDMVYLGCHSLSGISDPKGATTLLHCFDTDQNYEINGELLAAPGVLTGQITASVKKIQSELERMEELGCPGSLYVTQVDCGKLDVYKNASRGIVIPRFRISQVDDNNPQNHAQDLEYQQVYSIEAWAKSRFFELSTQREVTAQTLAANDAIAIMSTVCMDGCSSPSAPGQVRYAVFDSDGVGGTAVVQISTDYGTTWADTAADPFAINQNIVGITYFEVDKDTIRVVVAMEAPAGAQGMIAYADNPTATAATWTTVNIGGAAAGHGGLYGGCLHSRGPQKMWLASEAGYIYFSSDKGVTWTAQESGVVSANGYMQVKFFDDNYGFAVNDTGGVVIRTSNGGTSWEAGTVVTGTPALNCCEIVSERYVWVGTQTGLMYYSDDFAVTWTAETDFTGSGVGQIRDLHAINAHTIWMIRNTAAPLGSIQRTTNGGTDWTEWTGAPDFPVNSGVNAVFGIDHNRAMVVGEANGGTGFISSTEPSAS
jgi:photosystem II stability/assembly factor-like uncharacterized protein